MRHLYFNVQYSSRCLCSLDYEQRTKLACFSFSEMKRNFGFLFGEIQSNIRQSPWYCIALYCFRKVTRPSLLAEMFCLRQRRVPSVLPIPHRSLSNHIIHTSSVTAAKCKHNSQGSAKSCWIKYSTQQNSCCSQSQNARTVGIHSAIYVEVGEFQSF